MLVGARSQPAPKTPAPKAAPPRALSTGANPRGVAITPSYQHAVRQVFHAQPPATRRAIIRAAARNPSHPAAVALGISKAYGREPGGAMALEPRGLSAIQQSVAPLTAAQVAKADRSGNFNPLGDIGKGIVSGLAALQSATQIGGNGPGNVETFGSMGPKVATNAAKDLVNLPAEALASVAIPTEQAIGGHWHQALHSVIDPFVQVIKHPGKSFEQHPLNTVLMAGGLAHPLTRLADTAGSVALTGHLPNVKAESVHLTANMTHERPDFSKYPLIRFNQKQFAKTLYRRNDQGLLVPRDENVRARLIKLETSRLVGQNERVRVAHRSEQVAAHAQSVLASKGARAAHAVRTALQYDPKAATIPGADVLARIADGTIRKPGTVEQDLRTHLEQVAANRPNLVGRPTALKEHDAYVATLQHALENKAFLRSPDRAFKAADRYAKDYAKIEKAAHALGHFRNMTADALERRTLAHAVLTHMPGAHYDPELGLMVGDHKLSTEQMRQFVAKEHGRQLAFTSDQARAGDKAFYVSGQRRPMPAKLGNTYGAFLHGLTAPGHEALLEQRVRMQGVVDAHESMNRLADQLLVQNERTGKPRAWGSYGAAKRDAPPGYQPIRLAQAFHPGESLLKALETGKVNMATLEEEAARRQLDINSRLQPSSEPGTWGLIDHSAAAQLKAHEDLISPNAFLRGWRSATGQFRRVALATSFRHLPGVAQEQILRAVAEGIGPVSWFAGRATMKRAREINPKLGERRQIEMVRGGAATGQALSLQTRQVASHFEGTILHGPLNAFEKLLRAPGPRQASSAWRAWVQFTLHGTKRFLEQQTATSAIGKQVIADFGGRHGLLAATMGKWGQMVDQAAHGVLDERTARQMGSYVRRVYGRWTDLTPGEQTALMFSPFGYWWVNSIGWLARMPVDHPAGAAFMAALNSGTAQERQKLGLDMFSPNHLPLYQQGSIPIGQKLWGANYYSAFGVANNPGETATSLFMPYEFELGRALAGQDWKGSPINSPTNPTGRNKPTFGNVATVVMNSLLGSFVPLYTKAEILAEGGASKYDTSTLFRPQTKGKNPGLKKGLEKAVLPIRLSDRAGAAASSGGGWGGGSSSKSSSGGWGGGSSGGSGGWG